MRLQAARSVAEVEGEGEEGGEEEEATRRKEMVLVSNPERLSPSVATKPKTVLRY